MSIQSEKDLSELVAEQVKLIDNMTVELAAEKQRADLMQDEARKAVAFVQAEQQRYEKLAQELAAAKAVIPAQTGIPFMYGIMAPDGHAHIDECCVAGSPEALHQELNGLNDSPDSGYTIVPLYAAQLVQQPLPKWIDDQKGSGPDTDALIEYIEQMRAAQPVQQPAPVAGEVLPCPFCGSDPEFSAVYDPDERRYMAMDIECCAKMTATVSYPHCFEMSTNCLTQELKLRATAAWNERAAPVAAPVAGQEPVAEVSGSSRSDAGWHATVRWLKFEKFPRVGTKLYAAPVPAASVQGGVDWLGGALELEAQAKQVESKSARRAMESGAHRLRLMGQNQPDSGRDAALVDLIERTIERLSRAQIFDFVTEWRSYLAAHPANVAQPVSDAALEEAKRQGWDACTKANQELVRQLRDQISANVAQVGELSDEQIEAVAVKYAKHVAADIYDVTNYDCPEDFFNCVRAILAAAKKG